MHRLSLLNEATGVWTEFNFPGKWDELTREQFKDCARLLSMQADPVNLRVALLGHLAKVPAKYLRAFKVEHLITLPTEEQLAALERHWADVPTKAEKASDEEKRKPRLLPQLDAFFEEPMFRTSMVPNVFLRGHEWAGPENNLERHTLLQFVWVETLFMQLVKEPTSENFSLFLGAAYRPKDNAWTNEAIEEYGQRLAKLPTSTKLAALLNYRGLREYLRIQYPLTHAKSDEEPTSAGMFGMLYDASRTPTWSGMKNAKEAPLHEVLTGVEHALELEARSKKMNLPGPATPEPEPATA